MQEGLYRLLSCSDKTAEPVTTVGPGFVTTGLLTRCSVLRPAANAHLENIIDAILLLEETFLLIYIKHGVHNLPFYLVDGYGAKGPGAPALCPTCSLSSEPSAAGSIIQLAHADDTIKCVPAMAKVTCFAFQARIHPISACAAAFRTIASAEQCFRNGPHRPRQYAAGLCCIGKARSGLVLPADPAAA